MADDDLDPTAEEDADEGDALRAALLAWLGELAILSGVTISAANFPPQEPPSDPTLYLFDGAMREGEDGERDAEAIERDYALVLIQRLPPAPAQESDFETLRVLAKKVFRALRDFAPEEIGWRAGKREMATPVDYAARDAGVFRAQMTATFWALVED